MNLAIALAIFLAGFGAAWSWQGARGALVAADLRLEHANQAHESVLAAARRVKAKADLADTLAVRLAAAEKQRIPAYKEVLREIPAATVDRPCLSGDALGLLDNFAGDAAGVPATAGRPADQGGAVATDTQVAGWAASVIEQHERERARCNALIDWHAND